MIEIKNADMTARIRKVTAVLYSVKIHRTATDSIIDSFSVYGVYAARDAYDKAARVIGYTAP